MKSENAVGIDQPVAYLVRDPETGNGVMAIEPGMAETYRAQLESVNVKADIVPLYTRHGTVHMDH